MFEKICWIILFNIVFFAKTLCYKYASDDIPVFNNPPKTNNKFEKFLCWLDGRSRIEPQRDHLLTTLIHTTIAVFIYLGFGKSDISFFAAILFSFNPTNNQGSVWISGRAYALAALGMTGALVFPWIAGVFIMLSTYTNPGFFAPLALLGSKYASFVWLCIPFAYWMNWKRFTGNVKYKMDKEMIEEDKAIKWEKIILVIKTFGFYTMLTLIPFKNAFYHSFLQSSSGSGRFKAYSMKDRFFWIGLIFCFAMFAYMILTPWSMVSFGLLWWCICLAPFCNFMRMSQEIAERYCYLPSIGLMFALASFIHSWPVIVGVFISAYAVRLWFLMDMFQDEYYLLEHACLQDPSAWFAWHVRGLKRWENKSFQEAVIIWSMARLISPNEFKVNLNIATALGVNGNLEEAKYYLGVAEKNIPPGQEKQAGEMIAQWRAGQMVIIL